MKAVDVVVPDGIDDPLRPSGGNVYDRRIIDGLAELGWVVRERRVAELDRVPDGELVLVDGLLTPEVRLAHAQRLRLVVLLHMPLDTPEEREVLSAAAAVVATSNWTREWLRDTYGMSGDRIHVVEPGAELADQALGTISGGDLLCVGAVTPTKGHDVLAEALAEIDDVEWRCVCVGALDIDPVFVDRVRRVGQMMEFAGPLEGEALDAAYARADVLVSASRAETYGMVVTEALARGLPVVATEVGGVPESLGLADGGRRPGLLVPPDDPGALAAALRRWLSEAELRDDLRAAARARRLDLTGWSVTTERLSRALGVVAQQNGGGL